MVWPVPWGERLSELMRTMAVAMVRRPNPGIDPEQLLASLGDRPVALLDGARLGGQRATLVAWDPLWQLVARGGRVAGWAGEPLPPVAADPLHLVQWAVQLLPEGDEWPPGVIGTLGFEALAPTAESGTLWPDAWFIYPAATVVFMGDSLLLRAAGPAGELPARLAALEARLAAATGQPVPEAVPPATLAGATLSPADYAAGVRRIGAAIDRGELRKAVLSVGFAVATGADPVAVYRRYAAASGALRFFLRDGGATLLGVTPELLVRLEAGRCVMRPLAGTRRRGHTAAEDRELLAELQTNPKDRHEHLVAVAQVERDLGTVCAPGSVRTRDRLSVEIHPGVMHLASQVEGKLREGATGADLVRACFPAGTVAGAPREPALRLLRQIEPAARGPYAGAIGYWLPGGDLELFLCIRCLLLREGMAHVQTGAGIVAGSDPASEYQECRLKAAGALRALGIDVAAPATGKL